MTDTIHSLRTDGIPEGAITTSDELRSLIRPNQILYQAVFSRRVSPPIIEVRPVFLSGAEYIAEIYEQMMLMNSSDPSRLNESSNWIFALSDLHIDFDGQNANFLFKHEKSAQSYLDQKRKQHGL